MLRGAILGVLIAGPLDETVEVSTLGLDGVGLSKMGIRSEIIREVYGVAALIMSSSSRVLQF